MSMRPRPESRQYGQTKTSQSHKDGADISKIAAKYMTPNGLRIPENPGASRQPIWGTWKPDDFQESLNRMAQAKIAFNELPARLRSVFGNSPLTLVHWVNDPKNLHQAVKMGLVVPPDGYEAPPEKAPRNPQQMDLEIESMHKTIAELRSALSKKAQNEGKSE